MFTLKIQTVNEFLKIVDFLRILSEKQVNIDAFYRKRRCDI